eukprot:UN03565
MLGMGDLPDGAGVVSFDDIPEENEEDRHGEDFGAIPDGLFEDAQTPPLNEQNVKSFSNILDHIGKPEEEVPPNPPEVPNLSDIKSNQGKAEVYAELLVQTDLTSSGPIPAVIDTPTPTQSDLMVKQDSYSVSDHAEVISPSHKSESTPQSTDNSQPLVAHPKET